jgi:hypothetical protein
VIFDENPKRESEKTRETMRENGENEVCQHCLKTVKSQIQSPGLPDPVDWI